MHARNIDYDIYVHISASHDLATPAGAGRLVGDDAIVPGERPVLVFPSEAGALVA